MGDKRIRVTQAVEQDKTDKDKRIHVTQAVEQDKTDKDKRIRVTQAVEQDKTDKDKRINFAAFQKTRLYYEGLSSQEKEEFWGRVRRGNKADETKDSGTSHLHRMKKFSEFGNLLQWMQVEDTVKN